MDNPALPAPHRNLFRATVILSIIATLIIPLNILVFFTTFSRQASGAFYLLAFVQMVTGLAAGVCGMVNLFRRKTDGGYAWGSGLLALLGIVVGLGGPVGMFLGLMASFSGGGAWGRPLRIRGRQVHPELSIGSDWTLGDSPDASDLDDATKGALEALWLHDAQKEHASVPAFARITWMLCAVGAPAELVDGSNRAAAEEIDHARRCFALARGYGGRSHTAEPMPDLLLGGLDLHGKPLVVLAVESLKDGCLLEDFNADVAAVCARVCREPVTRDVLQRIAREERSHAEFSWAVLAWVLERGGLDVRRAVERAARELDDVPRPTAVGPDKLARVARADRDAMRRHGRIDDAEWADLWTERLASTRARLDAVLAPLRAAA